jgi:hypothetical protein
MKILFTMASLTAYVGFRVIQFAIGTIGLAHDLGLFWAVSGVLAALLLGFLAPLRLGAFLGAMSVWHWPWYAALIFAVPRLVLMLPGLISTGLAQLRHPRPVWARTV